MNSFFKFLSRNKLYTAINLLGLSVSLMFVILIANYVVKNLTVDSGVEKADRIYAVANDEYLGTGYWNGQKLKARYPQVEEACGITNMSTTIFRNNTEYNAEILFADTTFFNMFSIRLLEGSTDQALISKDNIVISKSFANRIFGSEDPIGKSITFPEGDENEKKERVVAGIMPDIENSVFPEADIVMNFLNMEYYNSSVTSEQMNNAGATTLFLLEKQGANLPSLENDICEYFKTYFWPYVGGSAKSVILIPFTELYFSDFHGQVTNSGDWAFVVILISVGILILLFSVLNYINLTVAQTGFRAKEMATRRLLGSSRGALFGKLIFESLLMCATAFVIGFLLAVAAQPFANDLLQSKISILSDLSGTYLVSYSGLVVLVSIVSGVIPAWVISNFQPIEVVRGSFRRKTSMVYGKILITFQNIITIALIGGSITMMWQIRHLINAPMGYKYKNVLDISAWSGFKNYGQVKAAVNELKQLPFVELVGQCQGTPLNGGNNNTTAYGTDRMISFQTFIGDVAYMKILDLKIKTDHKSAELNTSWYLNEYAFKDMQVDENSLTVKMGRDFDWEKKIAGVLYDFRVRSALSEPTPCQVRIIESFEKLNEEKIVATPWNILVKISDQTDKAEAYNQIITLLIRVTGSSELDVQYMEDALEEMYKDQQRTSDIVLIFTIIAILISALGLLAMSTYFIQQRRMEMAVRKVFGSTRAEVLNRVIGTFMKMVGVAFVIALPVIWFLMNWWLEDYSYRIALSPLIFVGAGIISSLIALLTIFWQSRRAAAENPVDAIKRG